MTFFRFFFSTKPPPTNSFVPLFFSLTPPGPGVRAFLCQLDVLAFYQVATGFSLGHEKVSFFCVRVFRKVFSALFSIPGVVWGDSPYPSSLIDVKELYVFSPVWW